MNTQPQKSYKILLVGDSCKDLYYEGTCDRLSPEAPVPVLKVNTIVTKDGMSSNIKTNMLSYGIDVDYFTNTEEIKKIRFIDVNSNYQLLRADIGENEKVSPFQFDNIDLDTNYDALVISDYCKGFITPQIAHKLVTAFKERNIPIFVDTKKTNIECYEGCIVKINKNEYKNLATKNVECELIITLGSQGSYYNNEIYPTTRVEVFDVCGAGDVFLASLVYKFLLTRDKPLSICYANLMASHSVTHSGNWIADPSIELKVHEDIHPAPSNFLENL